MTRAAKFSEAESAAIDAVRGDVRWSEWLRVVALAAAGHGQAEPASPSVAVNRNEPVNLNPVAVNLNTDPIEVNRNVTVNRNLETLGLVPASALPKPRRCTHPGTRVIGGYCKECDHLILSGGAWA